MREEALFLGQATDETDTADGLTRASYARAGLVDSDVHSVESWIHGIMVLYTEAACQAHERVWQE
eukprot:10401031-Alexandrium_andersonii.AAC.1